MTSSKPYLIRAIHQWVLDNKLTPYIVIDASVIGVQVPETYIDESGKIVLDISSEACFGLHLGNDRIIFSASFGGTSTQIYAPPEAVLAIYAKENGQGMVFNAQEDEDEDGSEEGIDISSSEEEEQPLLSQPPEQKRETLGKKHKKVELKIVK